MPEQMADFRQVNATRAGVVIDDETYVRFDRHENVNSSLECALVSTGLLLFRRHANMRLCTLGILSPPCSVTLIESSSMVTGTSLIGKPVDYMIINR